MSKNLIIATISIGSLSWLLFCSYLYFFQEKLIFKNDLAPKEVALPNQAKHLFLDGIEIGVIDNKSETTIFYFGGNANNALEILNLLYDLPFNIITFNYPGYANSKGKPSQKAIYESALKIYDTFHTTKNILIGRSLGTGVSAYVASKREANGMILITPYHSLVDLAKNRYPFCPVSYLLKHPFLTYQYISKVDAPTFVLLAQKDDITPPSTFESLKPFIKNLQRVDTIKDTNHINILSNPQTLKYIKSYLQHILLLRNSW